MSLTQPVLVLENVQKTYPVPGTNEPLPVLSHVSLSLTARQSVAIVGPSGSGKSTLLNIMGTLDRPTSGRVLIDGQTVESLDDTQLAALRNRKIGFVFQFHHLLPHCSVLENVLLPVIPAHASELRKGAPDRALELLKKVGLESRLTHRPAELSGGERQRVAVVRALINGPKLLLADEPTGALDRDSAFRLSDLLVELNDQSGVTLVVVTHADHLAQRMQRQFQLKEGKLVPY